KVAGVARMQHAKRRDVGRVEHMEFLAEAKAGPEREPGEVLAQRELIERFRERLSAEEWRIANERADGRGWPQIAQELAGTPAGLVNECTRAVERTERQLPLHESHDD